MRLPLIASLILLAVGGVTAVLTIYAACQWRIAIPVFDQLRQLELVMRTLDGGLAASQWQDWLAMHAGAHRITFLRLGMTLDYQWFGGRNHLIYALTAGAVCTALGYYLKLAAAAFHSRWQFAGFAGVLLFWFFMPGQLFNWVNPVNNSWLVAHAGICIAFCLLLEHEELTTARSLAALLLCFFAALCTFSGVPALLVAGGLILLRQPGLAVFVLPLILVVLYALWGVVLSDSSLPHRVAEQAGVSIPWYSVAYHGSNAVLTLLVAPLPVDQWPWLVGVAAAAVCYLAFQCIVLIRSTLKLSRLARLQLIAIALALLAVVLATSVVLSRWLFADLAALRYQSIVCLFWANVSALVYLQLYKRPGHYLAAACALSTLMLAMLYYSQNFVSKAGQLATDAAEFEAHARHSELSELRYQHLLPRDKHDYYQEYDAFFRRYRLAHRR